MKYVVFILKQIVIPLIFCFFLIIGGIAAVLSGIIEYAVIKELFSNYNGVSLSFIPLTIVIVLEGTKLFLHYAIPAQKRLKSNEPTFAKSAIKSTLIVFSLICTVVFTSNTLYSPKKFDEMRQTKIEEIEAQYEYELEQGIKNAEKVKEDDTEQKRIQLDIIKEQLTTLDSFKNVYESSSDFKRYQEEKLRLEELLKQAVEKYESEVDKIDSEYEATINTLKTNITRQKQEAIDALDSTPQYTEAGDNNYLISSIRFFASVFNNGIYDRSTYYISVLSISLLISIILEISIKISLSYVSANSEDLIDMIGKNTPEVEEKLRNRADKIIKLGVRAAIMLSVFLIFQVATEIGISSPEIVGFAFFSYFISIVFTNGRFDIKPKPRNDNVFAKANEFILPIVVQTLLCIVGFVILGIVLGHSFDNIAPTTIALSVGSVSGQILFAPLKTTI